MRRAWLVRDRVDPPLAVILLIFVIFAGTAASLDVVRDAYGIKGDEATYVTMALSIAHDADFRFERQDLSRVAAVYGHGPEGIFLKRGAHLSLALTARPPFLALERTPRPDDQGLFFGKAFIYPLIAAPFVRVAGLNGMLVLHVILLVGVVLCLYLFARQRMPHAVALLLSTGFLGASIAPLYAVWLTPETFNLATVAYAYFLWLWKEHPGASSSSTRLLAGPWSDVLAAILIGLVVFSKPSNGLLVAPMIGLALWRRQVVRAGAIGLVSVATVGLCFAVNAAISGEANYQGGDRKTFYGRFPFEHGTAEFDRLGIGVSTDALEMDLGQLPHNLEYFLVGRHFGFVPYYLPGAVIAVWALWRWREAAIWHALIGAAGVTTALVLLILLPNTWSGGGGPPGNRYFLSIYPALFFLVPTTRAIWPAATVWLGAALFTGQILVDPFVSARRPWQKVEGGLFRALPVELTMVNDLPVRLNQGRSRIPYGDAPPLLLYFLDENAYRPEPGGFWVSGNARAEIIVRTGTPLSKLAVSLSAPIDNAVTITVDGDSREIALTANTPRTLSFPVQGVRATGAQNFVVAIETSHGFIPSLRNPESADRRFLGVRVSLASAPADDKSAVRSAPGSRHRPEDL